MTEHTKEWARTLGGTIRCAVCGERMSQTEELRRINATERLTAEDARTATKSIHLTHQGRWKVHDALKAYANILEGKDD